MELQWNKRPCTYIKTNTRHIQSQEQTHELRIQEDQPDIGKVLCTWGQPVLRSKEWRGDTMVVSGGVNASVVYLPENGTQPVVMETWIPFQTKGTLSQTNRDGVVRTQCVLRGLDARILSARKMMLRANIAVLSEVLEQAESNLYTPNELPEDIEVLTNLYPAMLPKEAGEKQFYFEEELHIPDVVQLINISVMPEITEQNVVGSRGVIRGNGQLHYVYLNENSNIVSGDQQISFAQFIELDHDYDKNATLDIMLMLSSLEVEAISDGVKIHCGISAQYLVWNQELMEVTEDAYSNLRDLSMQQENLTLPMQLDERQETLKLNVQLPKGRMMDIVFRPDFPVTYRERDLMNIEIPGSFQYVYMDDDGNIQSVVENAVGSLEYPAAEGCQLLSSIQHVDMEQDAAWINLKIQTCVNQELPMISGVTLGEVHQQDGNQPTLILRRMDADSLWQLAKESGSTMNAIRKANQLTHDPSRGDMLLIPVN